MAQNIGTLITAAIRPNDSLDLIASAYANEILGGHQSYALISERNAIFTIRRNWGMFVSVYNDGANNGVYQLVYGLVDTNLSNNANWQLFSSGGGSGTVTSVSVTTANGVSGSVANPTTTPSITLILGAITPTSVLASGNITGANLSGNNTGDQTSIVGITGIKSQFDAALTDGDFLYVGDVTQYTNEDAQDAVGAMVDSTLVYVDATPLLTRAALTGDVTASQGSNITTIADNAVTLAKFQDITTASFLGRNTAGTGDTEVLSVATVKTLLNLSGTNTGDQTITLTGDVTGSGTGSFATTIANNAVTNAKAAQMAANTIKGNNTGSTANASDLTVAQAIALISPLTTKGDLFGYSTVNARIPIGIDEQVLIADSTQALGLKWANRVTLGLVEMVRLGATL